MSGCPRCRTKPGWVVVTEGEPGVPDAVRPCDACSREAFDAWRNGDFEPHHKGKDRDMDLQALDEGENIARLLAIRDASGV